MIDFLGHFRKRFELFMMGILLLAARDHSVVQLDPDSFGWLMTSTTIRFSRLRFVSNLMSLTGITGPRRLQSARVLRVVFGDLLVLDVDHIRHLLRLWSAHLF